MSKRTSVGVFSSQPLQSNNFVCVLGVSDCEMLLFFFALQDNTLFSKIDPHYPSCGSVFKLAAEPQTQMLTEGVCSGSEDDAFKEYLIFMFTC